MYKKELMKILICSQNKNNIFIEFNFKTIDMDIYKDTDNDVNMINNHNNNYS